MDRIIDVTLGIATLVLFALAVSCCAYAGWTMAAALP